MRPRAIVVLWRSVLAASVALAALCAPISSAAAQLQPVTVGLHGIFGDQAFLPDGYGTVVVELENRTRRTLRGTAGVLVGQPYGRGSRPRHAVRVDLPPPAPAPRALHGVRGRQRNDRGGLLRARRTQARRAEHLDELLGRESLAGPVADPPRIRGGPPIWIDPSTGAVGAAHDGARPLGVATTDSRTGIRCCRRRPSAMPPSPCSSRRRRSARAGAAAQRARGLVCGGRSRAAAADGDLRDAQIHGPSAVSRASATIRQCCLTAARCSCRTGSRAPPRVR